MSPISLTQPPAQPSVGEDGPQELTETTSRGNAAPECGRAGHHAAGRQAWGWWTRPGSTLLAGGGEGAQADAWPTCAVPTALLGGRVTAAGPSSERPEGEKS